MKQFIAHQDAAKTFAHKKGAVAAARRVMEKFGSDITATDFDTFEEDGRHGVIIKIETPFDDAKEIIPQDLAGFVIEPKQSFGVSNPEDPVVTKSPDGNTLIAARHGSKQQLLIDMLFAEGGASLDEMREACLKADGKPWARKTLIAGLYHHFPQKGYGVQTTDDSGTRKYKLTMAEGQTRPAARRPQAAQTKIDKIRDMCTRRDTRQSTELKKLSDDTLLEMFKNVTEAVKHLDTLESI